jgi:hypothetical protein
MFKIKPVPVVLQISLNLKKKSFGDPIYILRKTSQLFIQPFPGLIIDEDSTMKKERMRIAEVQYVVKSVRCSQINSKILCYCEEMLFDTNEELLKTRDFLYHTNWNDFGFPG